MLSHVLLIFSCISQLCIRQALAHFDYGDEGFLFVRSTASTSFVVQTSDFWYLSFQAYR